MTEQLITPRDWAIYLHNLSDSDLDIPTYLRTKQAAPELDLEWLLSINFHKIKLQRRASDKIPKLAPKIAPPITSVARYSPIDN